MIRRTGKKSENTSSKYKFVHLRTKVHLNFGRWKGKWVASLEHDHGKWRAYFETEREAALAVDKKLIELGEEPVNILKRK